MAELRFGQESIGEAELALAVGRAASVLEAAGLGPGRTAALLARNEPRFLVLSLALARIGATAVPLNWHFGAEDLRYILADSGAQVLIGHHDLLRKLGPGRVRALGMDVPPLVARAWNLAAAELEPAPFAERLEPLLAGAQPWAGAPRAAPPTLLYTSGTTGRPKGVRRPAITAQWLPRVSAVTTAVFGNRPGMRLLVAAPLYHAAPNVTALSALRAGGSAVVMPRFDAEIALALIERHRITHAFMVATMFVRLLRLPEATRRRYDLSSLERVGHGAGPCPPDVKRAMLEWLGPRLFEYYGSSEYGPIAAISSEEWLERPGSVGRAVPGARIAIYSDDGRRLGPGETGEIYCRQFDYPDFSYVNREGERAALERDGLVSCGDVGHLDADGYLWITDRKRDMVISGGVNLYPAEIEAALATMPGVADCAVFGIPDREFGEALAACVQPLPGAALDAEAVRAWVRERLGSLKQPKLVEFREALPREESGKIFKRRLRDPYWQDQPRRI